MRRTLQNQGFSLVEMAITLCIVGIVAMIVVPQFGPATEEQKLRAAATELVGGLEYAAAIAVQYQRPFGVKADTTGNWFRVYDSSPYPWPATSQQARNNNVPPVNWYAAVLNPYDKAWFEKDFDTIGTCRGVSIASAPAGGTVLFYADGHVSATDLAFVLGCGTRRITITVKGATGQVTVN